MPENGRYRTVHLFFPLPIRSSINLNKHYTHPKIHIILQRYIHPSTYLLNVLVALI